MPKKKVRSVIYSVDDFNNQDYVTDLDGAENKKGKYSRVYRALNKMAVEPSESLIGNIMNYLKTKKNSKV